MSKCYIFDVDNLVMKKVITHTLFFCFLSSQVICQNPLFEEKANFPEDLKKILSVTKNQGFIMQGNNFNTQVWNNSLMDDINKQKLTDICKMMLAKKVCYKSILPAVNE